MINFSDGLILRVISMVEKYPHILDFIRNKKFRVSDTQLSYRQINSLDASDVLDTARDNESSWRSFSLKDLLYLQMISNCRKFGVTNDMLKMLKQHLYYEADDDEMYKSEQKMYYGEWAIVAVMFGVRVGWMLYENGKSLFTDMAGLVMFNGDTKPEPKSYLYLNINDILRGVFNGTKLSNVIPEQPSLGEIIRSQVFNDLSAKEIEILEIVRQKEYTKVTIEKKESGKVMVYGEAQNSLGNLDEKALLKLLQSKDFTNISVQKREGKLVTYTIEDVYKVQ